MRFRFQSRHRRQHPVELLAAATPCALADTATRILVDLRLQTGRYTYDQAARHWQKHLGFTAARSEAEINWYSASPSVPMSYWLGRLENERRHRRLVIGRGWTLQQFNDWLLSFGTLPQAWLEKYGLD